MNAANQKAMIIYLLLLFVGKAYIFQKFTTVQHSNTESHQILDKLCHAYIISKCEKWEKFFVGFIDFLGSVDNYQSRDLSVFSREMLTILHFWHLLQKSFWLRVKIGNTRLVAKNPIE